MVLTVSIGLSSFLFFFSICLLGPVELHCIDEDHEVRNHGVCRFVWELGHYVIIFLYINDEFSKKEYKWKQNVPELRWGQNGGLKKNFHYLVIFLMISIVYKHCWKVYNYFIFRFRFRRVFRLNFFHRLRFCYGGDLLYVYSMK